MGVSILSVKKKFCFILSLTQLTHRERVEDLDFFGPTIIFFLYFIPLLFRTSSSLAYFYAFLFFAIGLVNMLLKLLYRGKEDNQLLKLYNTISILLYCLLPLALFSYLLLLLRIKSKLALLFSLIIVGYSAHKASSFYKVIIRTSDSEDLLLSYPLFLIYTVFILFLF